MPPRRDGVVLEETRALFGKMIDLVDSEELIALLEGHSQFGGALRTG